MSKLKALGYGMAAAACFAGSFIFLENGQVDVRHASDLAEIAANGVEASTIASDCASNDEAANQADGNRCALGTLLPYTQSKVSVIGKAFSAAEFVMYSPLSEIGLGSALAVSSLSAPADRESPDLSPWATSVETN
jgi:hypothetical protein